jgi:hypothetical protein
MKTARWVQRGLPLILLAMIGLVVWLNTDRQTTTALAVACPDLTAGCRADLEGRAVRFGSDRRIKALAPFELWADAPGARKVAARFTMEGMDMGFNLYTLRPDAQGMFRAAVTLPVCVSGRRDWNLILEIDGRRLSVPFVTEL